MICNRCLRQSLSSATRTQIRPFSRSTRSPAENLAPKPSTTTAGRTSSGAPAATAVPSAAQPFSTPPGVSPTSRGDVPKGKNAAASITVKSSVSAGTSLKGLNFTKGKEDPVAMEDHEYPEWLWTILQKKAAEDSGVDLDIFSKSRAKRQKALKRAKKAGINPLEAATPRVPLYEQTIDLPRGDGTLQGALEAEEARGDLTKAMRGKRRANIKEANFLKTMS